MFSASAVAAALEALGPARVRRGMQAFRERSEVGWDRGFVARAYGPAGALWGQIHDRVHCGVCTKAADLLGLTYTRPGATIRQSGVWDTRPVDLLTAA
jgi:hypothetical protein